MGMTIRVVSSLSQPDADLPIWLSRAIDAGLSGADAAAMLIRLAAGAVHAKDPDQALRHQDAGRRLAGAFAIRHLLDTARDRSAGLTTLAVALRFRGPDVIDPLLERLHAADDQAARRVYLQLAIALGRFPEIRGPLVARLQRDLDHPLWFVVRNAIGLLVDIGADVPARHDLATHAHRQVRLALAKAMARRPADPSALDTLMFLLGDPDTSVRYASVVALGAADTPRGRRALSLHAGAETDPEVLHATRTIIKRRDVRRIA